MPKRPIVSLTDFEIIRPRTEAAQEDMLRWLALAYARADAAATGKDTPDPAVTERMMRCLYRFGCSPERIRSRGIETFELSAGDFVEMDIHRFEPASAAQGAAPSPGQRGAASVRGAAERTEFFARAALDVLTRLYPAGAEAPAQLIHVTCTGYRSPSAAQRIVELRGWHGRTAVTHAYHMGCYASLPAVRIAEGLVAVEPGRVDIVHTEVCSLHLNPLQRSAEQIVVYSLFADGHVKYSALPAADRGAGAGLDLLAVHEHILPGTHDSMTWSPAAWGMQMTLSRSVPLQIAGALADFIGAMARKAGLRPADLLSRQAREAVIFAVHPGGPRIIDSVQEVLGLDDSQLRHSKAVLLDYGNMSSATLPHIWHAILRDESIPAGKLVVSLAFGPGLTLFGAILRTWGGKPE